MKKELINKEEVKANDTIIINGKATTISAKYIKNDPFLGVTINGINFRKKIERVLFPKWYKGKIIGYFSQI